MAAVRHWQQFTPELRDEMVLTNAGANRCLEEDACSLSGAIPPVVPSAEGCKDIGVQAMLFVAAVGLDDIGEE